MRLGARPLQLATLVVICSISGPEGRAGKLGPRTLADSARLRGPCRSRALGLPAGVLAKSTWKDLLANPHVQYQLAYHCRHWVCYSRPTHPYQRPRRGGSNLHHGQAPRQRHQVQGRWCGVVLAGGCPGCLAKNLAAGPCIAVVRPVIHMWPRQATPPPSIHEPPAFKLPRANGCGGAPG